LEKPSQVPGAKVEDSLSKDYPFKKQREVRPPRNKRGFHNKGTG